MLSDVVKDIPGDMPECMPKLRRIFVSGGAGFIGSALVRMLIQKLQLEVINVDALTYAGQLSALASVDNSHLKALHRFYQLDIWNAQALNELMQQTQPDAVFHLAAQTHVDRSIDKPAECIQTNVTGTLNMLEAARTYWQRLTPSRKKAFRFLHVSTDEVYGDIAPDAPGVQEGTVYAPRSPYAASKAGADHLVRAWHTTYGLPVLLTHCCNNYGPYQYPEKLIPHMILNALAGKPLPVYGDGLQQRQWIYVDDHVRALWQVLVKGQIGQTYHIAAPDRVRNIDLVRLLCDILQVHVPKGMPTTAMAPAQQPVENAYASLITHVADRPGHDRRYALAADKIQKELGWKPAFRLAQALEQTVVWYLENCAWWEGLLASGYRLNRQGIQGIANSHIIEPDFK